MVVTSQGTEVREGATRLVMGQGPPEEGGGDGLVLLATSKSSSSHSPLLLVGGVATPITTVCLDGPPLSSHTNQLIFLVHACRPYMIIFLFCIFIVYTCRKNCGGDD